MSLNKAPASPEVRGDIRTPSAVSGQWAASVGAGRTFSVELSLPCPSHCGVLGLTLGFLQPSHCQPRLGQHPPCSPCV